MSASRPHDALRVPVAGDGAGSGPWDESVQRTPDGVPILVADPAAYSRAWGEHATAPLDALPFDAMCMLARYLPQLAAPAVPLQVALAELLARHAPGDAALGVDAGCSVGPHIRTLREVCAHVVAFDTNPAAVRIARRQLEGATIDVPRRLEGHRFEWADPVALPAIDGVTVVVGDALDPPLHAGAVDVAIAMNLFDNVPQPLNLLGQLDAILKPGGLLVVATPLSWHDGITPVSAQLGGSGVQPYADLGSERTLHDVLSNRLPVLPLHYDVVETRDVPWTLQEHARLRFTYDVHIVAARKRA